MNLRRPENEKKDKIATKKQESTQRTTQGDESNNLTLIKGGRGGSK
jgi:hypothetical protein